MLLMLKVAVPHSLTERIRPPIVPHPQLARGAPKRLSRGSAVLYIFFNRGSAHMTTAVVSSGVTSSGLTINAGDVLDVRSGGVAVDITVGAGGVVSGAGTVRDGGLIAGAVTGVSLGGTDFAVAVPMKLPRWRRRRPSPSWRPPRSRWTAEPTIGAVSLQHNTNVLGAVGVVADRGLGQRVFTGQYISSGGLASGGVFVDGGTEVVEAGGAANRRDAELWRRWARAAFATQSSSMRAARKRSIQGAVVSGVVVVSSGGMETIASGGHANDLTVQGGRRVVGRSHRGRTSSRGSTDGVDERVTLDGVTVLAGGSLTLEYVSPVRAGEP